MTFAMWALAVVALAGMVVSISIYLRTRRISRSIETRAESLYHSTLALERATDRALSALVNPEPEPTTGELELHEVLRRLTRIRADAEFTPRQIVFATWDPAQARRALEFARGTGALTEVDVDYLELTRRLGSEIAHDPTGKRKLHAAF